MCIFKLRTDKMLINRNYENFANTLIIYNTKKTWKGI